MRSEGSAPPEGPGQHIWIDGSAGVAGDMLLGALLDAGATVDAVQHAIDAVLPATVRVTARAVRRAGFRATKADVEVLVPQHEHRRATDIQALIRAADLDPVTRERALSVFARLAEAEARAHGIDVDRVHFHEVGAWDSIADVVGVCAALTELEVATASGGPVAVGSGTVRTAHGEMPVPVPAVLELSRGWQVSSRGEGERATPTGMALLTTLATECHHLPPLVVRAVGVGAGTRDDAGRPNVTRVVVGQPVDSSSATETATPRIVDAVVLESNIDDLDPRVWPTVLASLLSAGASDAWLTPVLMKKGRPAHVLSVLSNPDLVDILRDRIIDLVPALGVRETAVRKTVLERDWVEVVLGETVRVRIKVGVRAGVLVTATPEFDDVARAAEELGRPIRDVLARATAAAQAAGLVPGAPAPTRTS